MNEHVLEEICEKVYRQFPQAKETTPKISNHAGNYLLIFQVTGKAPDGQEIQQLIRVVATGTGQILKTSMSR